MSRARVRDLTIAAALAALLAGCGDGQVGPAPPLGRVPLVNGARVGALARACDSGARAYCGLEAVIVGARFRSARDLFNAERATLAKAGWSSHKAQTGDERAAESPDHALRLTLATADADLKGWDLGWIQRERPIVLALSRTLIRHTPAISLTLMAGSS